MPDTAYLVAVVLVAAAVTVTLRASPFVAVHALRSSPLVDYLGRHLPTGVMVVLVIYLLRDVPVARPLVDLRELAAIGVTVAVQLWRRQPLTSMAAGTAVYGVFLALGVT